MFTETFPQFVVQQLNRRSQNNYIQSKIPFVFAYSNIRYPKNSLQQNLQKSILSSINFQKQDVVTKHKFTDFYQIQSSQFGTLPKPSIKTFTIQSQGDNSLFRRAKLEIQCYSPIQFLQVKKYFTVPASSIFFQFGYYSQNQIKNIMLPILQNTIDNTSGTYLDQKTLAGKYVDSVNTDYFTGMISQVAIDQQDTKFKIHITLIGQGQSQILNYIRMSTQDLDLKTPLNKDFIINLANKYTLEGQSLLLTSSKQRYVTYNWVTTLLLPLLRKQNSSQYFTPMVAFKPQKNFDIDIISNNPKVIICSDLLNLTDSKSVKVNSTHIKETYNKYKNTLMQIYEQSKQNLIDQQYKNLYGKYVESNQEFFWLGNVYISLNQVLDIIFKTQALSITTFLRQLQQLVTGCIPRLTVHNQPNQKLKIYTITTNGLNYLLNDIYNIPNLGTKSIVKSITYQIQLPTTYQRAVIAKNTQQCGHLISQLFGGQFPVDIYQASKNQWAESKEQESQSSLVSQLSEKQLQLKSLLKTSISKQGILLQKVIQSQTYIKNINILLQKIIDLKNQIISIQSKTKSISSAYSIKVQINLDFIANIQFGHVFRLQFNPLGLMVRFYVNQVKYTINSDYAETTLTGFMLG